MIKRILALGVIGIAAVSAQNAGRGGRGAPPPPAEPGTAKERQLWAYDVKPVPNYVPPKTVWGDPDLQGIWPINHLIAVPLTRPKQYGDRLYRTDQEFASLTARARGTGPIPDRDYPDRLMRQLSLIVDPKDGQFPELTEYGKKLQAEMKSSYKPGQTVFDSVDDFSAWDHCITRGMPVSMEPRNYNNGIRIMQSPGYVTIVLEMAHEVRIVPIGKPPLASEIKEYLGESRGHWEGNTLVVESTNFSEKSDFHGSDTNLRLIEKFTRTGPDSLMYEFTVDDPTAFTKTWSGQVPMRRTDGPILEYACHEGNYAMSGMLAGARAEEKEAAQGGK
jgi:hypothetical protein